jgi:sugar phosphate isomerase/epimerase
MRLGFSTNTLADVDPATVLPTLAELGYESLAITLDRHVLDPFAPDIAAELTRWRQSLAAARMRCVIETGARHLLDPLVKHEPTLVSGSAAARGRRSDLLVRAVDVAGDLDADCVSLWAGVVRDAAPAAVLWERITTAFHPVLAHAARRGVRLGFEPEPGMFIDTLDRCDELRDRLGRPAHLGLTVDLGHLECMGERPVGARLGARARDVVNVHVDDMLACRHEHLPLGAGDVDFAAALDALTAGGYRGGLHVELPRQSHRWLDTARHSAAFLRPLLGG